jgi:hypothetical protein
VIPPGIGGRWGTAPDDNDSAQFWYGRTLQRIQDGADARALILTELRLPITQPPTKLTARQSAELLAACEVVARASGSHASFEAGEIVSRGNLRPDQALIRAAKAAIDLVVADGTIQREHGEAALGEWREKVADLRRRLEP